MTREAAAAVLITAGTSATAFAVTAAVFASGNTSLTPFIPPLRRRIPLNAWTHVAVRLQPADDKATLFVNGTGESRMSSKLSEDFGSAVPAVDLGCMGLLGFVGLMDEVVCTAYVAQPVAPLLALYLLEWVYSWRCCWARAGRSFRVGHWVKSHEGRHGLLYVRLQDNICAFYEHTFLLIIPYEVKPQL